MRDDSAAQLIAVLERARPFLGPALAFVALVVIPIGAGWQLFLIAFFAGVISGGLSAVILVPVALVLSWAVRAAFGSDFGPSPDGGQFWMLVGLVAFTLGASFVGVLTAWLGETRASRF